MATPRATRHPARRGIVTRLFSMLLGLVIAAGLVVGIQLPVLHRPMNVRVTLNALATPVTPSVAWPSVGESALAIPSLGVLTGHDDHVVPIASLTKMMTAYVALERLPLGIGQTGPCHEVTYDDVDTYNAMDELDESSVVVEEGEQLCEADLLNGLLVHSAGNYAVMLANMVDGSTTSFIALMNHEAAVLGLTGTHYDDVTGYSPLSVSTARDQARLATLLMRSPLVRSIVIQPSVDLPVAGVVASFTPDVGLDGVIGVKSGRTTQAGGCDVMAMQFQEGDTTHVVYAVVLGQRGGNLLGPAGEAALALAQSSVASITSETFRAHDVVGYLTSRGHRVPFGVATNHQVSWFPAQGRPHVIVETYNLRSSVHRGEVVGRLLVRGAATASYPLQSFGALRPPTLWQRLR